MAEQGPPLTVTGISKRFVGVQALRDVSLSVGSGEILGLLGANGAGKTTLLDIIGGEQESDEGEIVLNGRHLTGPPHKRSRIGLARTFQHPKVAMDLTVAENVACGLAVQQLSGWWRMVRSMGSAILTGRASYRRAVAEACALVGLGEIDRPASTLSFGELRLVEVARALIQQPAMVLLDEPFPGLEDDGVVALTTALRAIAKSGRSVIIVDHNVTLVAELVDRVVLLARGQVAFAGSVEDCLASPTFHEEYIGGKSR